ncbi:MAG: VWA domain-containing protein [Lachnospiraceae bacterium]|nr:VWA domain-containing protein [Lachnospiraceae bacterium]
MELMYRWVIYIGLPVLIILPFVVIRKGKKDKPHVKAANASYVMDNPSFKRRIIIYKIMRVLAFVGLWGAIAFCFIMISRPVEVKTYSETLRNRDIFLCMDISGSMDELNYEICDDLKEIVNGLDGERFGITIFCGKSVVLVPLTTDYDYVLSEIDRLKDSFQSGLSTFWYTDFDYESYYYTYAGTLSDYGSSLIGDGLASCLFDFPGLKEDSERSRLIILSTDNEVIGEQFVDVTEATDLCQKYGVKVFALAPQYVENESSFKRDIEKTGGGFYKISNKSNLEKIIEDIGQTDSSDIEEIKTSIIDRPKLFFYILVICAGVYFIFGRKVKL